MPVCLHIHPVLCVYVRSVLLSIQLFGERERERKREGEREGERERERERGKVSLCPCFGNHVRRRFSVLTLFILFCNNEADLLCLYVCECVCVYLCVSLSV